MIDEIESQFTDEEVPHINKLRGQKGQYSKLPHYPQHPSPYLLFEEKNKFQTTYDREAIIGWNVDRLTKLMENVAMCDNAYIAKKVPAKSATNNLDIQFTG